MTKLKFDPRIVGSNTMLNYKLSHKLKLIERGKFNYLIVSLTYLIWCYQLKSMLIYFHNFKSHTIYFNGLKWTTGRTVSGWSMLNGRPGPDCISTLPPSPSTFQSKHWTKDATLASIKLNARVVPGHPLPPPPQMEHNWTFVHCSLWSLKETKNLSGRNLLDSSHESLSLMHDGIKIDCHHSFFRYIKPIDFAVLAGSLITTGPVGYSLRPHFVRKLNSWTGLTLGITSPLFGNTLFLGMIYSHGTTNVMIPMSKSINY